MEHFYRITPKLSPRAIVRGVIIGMIGDDYYIRTEDDIVVAQRVPQRFGTLSSPVLVQGT